MPNRFPGPNPLDKLDIAQAQDPMPQEHFDQMRGEHIKPYHYLYLEDSTSTAHDLPPSEWSI